MCLIMWKTFKKHFFPKLTKSITKENKQPISKTFYKLLHKLEFYTGGHDGLPVHNTKRAAHMRKQSEMVSMCRGPVRPQPNLTGGHTGLDWRKGEQTMTEFLFLSNCAFKARQSCETCYITSQHFLPFSLWCVRL